MFGGTVRAAFAALFALCLPATVFALQVNSPDTRISVTIDTDPNGAPFYSVNYRGKTVVQ